MTDSLSGLLGETLAVFEDAPDGAPLTTSEVTDQLDVGRRGTYDRLERLVDCDHLETKEVGARGRVWWQPPGATTPASRDRTPDDVSDRRERALAHYERIVETVQDGVYVLDDEFRFVLVNDAYVEMTGYDRAELLGSPATLVVDEDVSRASLERVEEIAAGEGSSATIEADIQRADGSTLRAESKFTALPTEGDERPWKVGVVRDVSERRERERELERYETLFEESTDVNVVVDEDGTYQYVSPSVSNVLGYDKTELLGENGFEYIHPDDREDAMDEFVAMVEDPTYEPKIEFRFRHSNGSWVVLEALGRNLLDDPDIGGIVVYTRDVTERKRREEELAARVSQQEVVAELGQQALATPDLDDLMSEATHLVAETFDGALCKVLELRPYADELLLREGVGFDDGVVGTATVTAAENSQAGYTLQTESPVIVDDLATETRFSGSPLLTDHGVESGVSVVIGSPDDPWGILGVHDDAGRQFTPQDASFVQAVANVLATAIGRRERERRLQRRRQELEALDDLNGVVRGITEAVIEQSTREEVERLVCERLAEAASYEFAWIGGLEADGESIEVRAEAATGSYLDDVTITTSADDTRGRGPTGRAVRTGEMRVSRDVREDPDYAEWRDQAREHGFRSSAAIPIVHEDTTYGVLNVYAPRSHAFAAEEQAVIGQLGEVVGHAIASIERKQALMSDEVVELQFHVADLFGALDVDIDPSGTITLGQVVPVSDGTYLVYGTVTDGGWDTLTSLAEALPHWREPSMLDDGSGRFELPLSEPPVLSILADNGGDVKRARVEEGDYDMTVHLPPTVDARRVVDAIQEAYPDVDLVARRQETRTEPPHKPLDQLLDEDLTDRQHTALEAALYAGFFEWPRDTTGEAVAESLGVSAPTFHRHLRTAQRSLLTSVLGRPTDPST
ncbi:PAS domain S-box protein [Haloarchaeobius sp. HRN-SO-5]|uniref:PAS domain S-box protein n=1 Tax=Haloarchaeobius sp. HRN-SO-5 TaxID=3446118 RepID=UPI003EB9E705